MSSRRAARAALLALAGACALLSLLPSSRSPAPPPSAAPRFARRGGALRLAHPAAELALPGAPAERGGDGRGIDRPVCGGQRAGLRLQPRHARRRLLPAAGARGAPRRDPAGAAV